MSDKSSSPVVVMNGLAQLSACEHLLQHYGGLLVRALNEVTKQEDAPTLTSAACVTFLHDSLMACRTLATSPRFSIQAFSLLRGPYELAVRAHWATVSENGWLRTQKWAADQDRKWADEAIKHAELQEHAQDVQRGMNDILAGTGKHGEVIAAAPMLPKVLYDIELHDQSPWRDAVAPSSVVWEYTNVDRVMCRPAHGHPAFLDVSSDTAHKLIVFGAVVSTRHCLCAICRVLFLDPRTEIANVERQLEALLEET